MMKKHAWVWAVAAGLACGLLAAAALNVYTRPPRPRPVAAEPAGDADAPPKASDAAQASAESAPGPPRTTPQPRRALPFGPGERLVYDVAWTLVNAGTITLTLADEHDERGARTWHLRAEGQVASVLASLYPLHYTAESSVDPVTLLPRRAEVNQQEAQRRRTRVTVFDHAAQRAHYEQVGGRQADVDTPAEVWDSLSVLYALRAAPALRPGAGASWAVCDGGRLYTVAASAGESAGIDTPAGRFGADKITLAIRGATGEAETTAASLWLSSDGRRLPVKIEVELAVGRFTVVLREITRG